MAAGVVMLEGEHFVSSGEEDVEQINPDDEDPTGTRNPPWRSRKSVKRESSKKHKQAIAYLRSKVQLDYLAGVTSANLMQEVSGKADCIIYKSLINENAILFHLILRYHREIFIELYEQFSKGKEKYLKLQISWHKSCSLFLLPKDIEY